MQNDETTPERSNTYEPFCSAAEKVVIVVLCGFLSLYAGYAGWMTAAERFEAGLSGKLLGGFIAAVVFFWLVAGVIPNLFRMLVDRSAARRERRLARERERAKWAEIPKRLQAIETKLEELTRSSWNR